MASKARIPDFADAAVADWKRERPDLDFAAMGTIARFARLSLIAGRSVDALFASHGLDRGEFDVLATLRRAGSPFRLTPSRLADAMLITRAGMTKRVERLHERGLVSRVEHEGDRRSHRVALTPAGLECVDRAVTAHTANESRLLAAVGADDLRVFDRVLRELLTAAGADGTGEGT